MPYSRGLLGHVYPGCNRPFKRRSLEHAIKRLAPHHPTAQTTPHVPLEPFPVHLQILGSLLVKRIARVGLEEQELQTDDNRVEVEHGLPVLAQDVQAHVALEVDVGVVDFLRALDLGRVVREVLVDGEAEVEAPALVHALVWVDGEREVEDVVWVWEVRLHRRAEGEFFEICAPVSMRRSVGERGDLPFCARSCAGVTFFFLLVAAAAASSSACFFFCVAVSSLRPTALAPMTYHRPYFHHLGGIV
ncbi:hypothetical protein OPT61_g8616 [Boeremia exigua]|uniref:Uncharacterized protein n=1 Tax=Boeremia exigua TaxID=749465 RepID=A0ACC2HY54_9PLEO|nr:hypothetical protein OPT61_g8616 [Boeremia exigua]